MTTLSARLLAARDQYHLSRLEVCRAAGIAYNTLLGIERGTIISPHAQTVRKLYAWLDSLPQVSVAPASIPLDTTTITS